MATATLTFRRCVMNSPETEADDHHVGARVYFDLDVEGRQHANLFADVREPIGVASHEEFLEVSTPHNYSGPLNVPVFQGLVEFYYRHVIGAGGLIFGAKSTDMKYVGYVLEQEMQVQFEVT